MATKLSPYISFKDNTREAMEFYKTVFGGTLDIRTFKDFGASQDPSEDNLIMHSVLYGDDGVEFMASDTPPRMEYKPGTNVSMSLSGEEEGKLTGYFIKLSVGGNITMPLDKALWGDVFGMLTDKFGINWYVNISMGTPPDQPAPQDGPQDVPQQDVPQDVPQATDQTGQPGGLPMDQPGDQPSALTQSTGLPMDQPADQPDNQAGS